MMAQIGTLLRHFIGAAIGGLVGALVAWMAGHGVEVDPGQVADFVALTTNALVLGATVFGYAFVEKVLKNARWLDIRGYIDQKWLNHEAANPSAETRTFIR